MSDISNVFVFRLLESGFRVVHEVHDEVVCEVPKETCESDRIQIEKIALEVAREFCPDVLMSVESGISDCWEKL